MGKITAINFRMQSKKTFMKKYPAASKGLFYASSLCYKKYYLTTLKISRNHFVKKKFSNVQIEVAM